MSDTDDQPMDSDDPTVYRDVTQQVTLRPAVKEKVQSSVDTFCTNSRKIKARKKKKKTAADKPYTESPREKRKRRQVSHAVEVFEKNLEDRTVMEETLDTGETSYSGDGTTLKATKTAIKEFVVEETGSGKKLNLPYGQQRGGFGPTVKTIPTKSMAGFRPQEWLGWLSETFFEKVDTMEVEAMVVNGRVFVSTNDQGSVKDIAAMSLHELLEEVDPDSAGTDERPAKLKELASAMDGDTDEEAASDEEPTTGMKYLVEGAIDYHRDYLSREPIRDFLSTLRKQVKEKSGLKGPFSPDAAKDLIEDEDHWGEVIVVSPPAGDRKSHAEQHLVLVLALAGYKNPATIAGTKVPCTTCWLTLTLARQAGYNILYNNTPGGFWDTSTYRGLNLVMKELGEPNKSELEKALLQCKEALGDGEFIQWVTDLDKNNADSRIVKVAKGMTAKKLTQDRTGLTKHTDFSTMSPLHDDIETPPTPPRGGYGTPKRDDDSDSDDL